MGFQTDPLPTMKQFVRNDLQSGFAVGYVDLARREVAAFGFSCLERAIGTDLLGVLRQECAATRETAQRAQGDHPLAYRSFVAPLGSVGRQFLTGPDPAAILGPIFGRRFAPCADACCYTYFEGGDFLSPHLDGAHNCEVTLLLYLSATTAGPDPATSGLYLSIYEATNDEAPQLLKAIPTPEGAIMIGHGCQTLHGRSTLAPDERIWMLTACFTSVGD